MNFESKYLYNKIYFKNVENQPLFGSKKQKKFLILDNQMASLILIIIFVTKIDLTIPLRLK